MVELIKVIAENTDDHLRCFAGDCFADPVAEKGQHFGLNAGEFFQRGTNLLLRLFLFLGRKFVQFHMKLTAMRSPSVFAHLGAADLLLDRFDMPVFQQFLGDAPAQPQHLRQRRSRSGGNLEHEMPFAE